MKKNILTCLIIGLVISSNHYTKTSPSLNDCGYFAVGATAMGCGILAFNSVFKSNPTNKAKTAAVIYGALTGITLPTFFIPLVLNDYAKKAIENHAYEDKPTEQVLNSRISEADMYWWAAFLGGITVASGSGLKYFWK